MITILFICHGNICRSPMAEFMLKDMINKRGIADNFFIESAATSSEEIWNGRWNPVYPPAKEELAKHGISCEGKRARQLTKADYAKYDHLIVMDEMNLRDTERITCHKGGKISMLLSYTDHPRAISDPWYSGNFTATYNDIKEGLEAFLDYIKDSYQTL